MFRIDDQTATTSLPTPEVAGIEGYFTEGDPVAGTPATLVRSSFLNMVQEELRAIVVGGGLTPNKAINNQVLTAIRAIAKQAVILTDTGAVNAYAAVNPTPLTLATLVHGVHQQVQFTHANTGASTYSPDGLTAKPIYGMGLAALQGNEIPLSSVGSMIYFVNAAVNSGNGAWILIECTGGAQQGAPATASGHLMQLGQATGRLINIQRFTSSGTYTPTAGTASVIVEVQGAGGGGGGVAATGAGVSCAGPGGGGGGYSLSRLTSGFSGASIVIGTNGLGVSGAAGTAGGTSSFGGSISATGGGGGTLNTASSTLAVSGNAGGGIGTGGNLANSQGGSGNFAVYSSSAVASGFGGLSEFGAGANIVATTLAGQPSQSAGAGGSGAAALPSSAAQAGGNGGLGIVVIYEYA